MRNHRGVSQQTLADASIMHQKTVSRIENGTDEYSKDELKAIKNHLDIANMPLTEEECNTFRGRLYYWRDLIRNGRMTEAKVLQDELEKITNLDVLYFDLPTLYRIFEVLFLMTEISFSSEIEKDFNIIKEKMKYLEGILDEMNTEHRYHYNCQLGAFYSLQNDNEKALEHYNQALDIMKQNKDILPNEEATLYYNIAVCYTDLEKPNRALMFLNNIPKKQAGYVTTGYSLGVDITLAINLYRIGLYDEAEKVLLDCLEQAKGMNDKLYIGLVFHHLGILHKYAKNWEKSIECSDQALSFFDEDTRYHAWALYFKIRCMMETGKLSALERELRQIALSFKKYPRYLVVLEALKYTIHLRRSMSRYDINAVTYLENVAIPIFEKRSHSLEAIDCYKLLEEHFGRTSKQKKTLETRKKIIEIYERMV